MFLKPEHQSWLSACAQSGRGGAKLIDDITRGLVWQTKIKVPADWSGDAIVSSIGYEPDDGASEVADLSVTVSAFSGGFTTITLELNGTGTGGIAADGDGDGVSSILVDLYRTPSGGGKYFAGGFYTHIIGTVGNV